MSEDTTEPPPLEIYWHHIPTHFSDGPVGSARAGGLQRIVMGEICFNVAPGAEKPASRPVFNLVMSNEAIRNFITYLQGLEGVGEG